MMTPYEKLRSLPETESHLKPGTTLEKLDAIAAERSDNDAAQCLNEARTTLFQLINHAQPEHYLTKTPSFRLMSGLENTPVEI
mgnify:FL=1